jgi:hypothetical protein
LPRPAIDTNQPVGAFYLCAVAAPAVPRGQVIFQSVPGGISAAMFAWNTGPYLARRTVPTAFSSRCSRPFCESSRNAVSPVPAVFWSGASPAFRSLLPHEQSDRPHRLSALTRTTAQAALLAERSGYSDTGQSRQREAPASGGEPGPEVPMRQHLTARGQPRKSDERLLLQLVRGRPSAALRQRYEIIKISCMPRAFRLRSQK